MIVIDENKIFEEIKNRKPTSVSLNGPDGILNQVQEVSLKIMKRFGIPAYVLADTTWGSCDLNSNGAEILKTEILFNIGHTNTIPVFEKNVVMIDAFDDISFENVIPKCVDIVKGKTVSLITDSQHLHQIQNVKQALDKCLDVNFIQQWKKKMSLMRMFSSVKATFMQPVSHCLQIFQHMSLIPTLMRLGKLQSLPES